MAKDGETEEVSCPTCNGTGRVKPAGDETGSKERKLFSGKPIPASRLW